MRIVGGKHKGRALSAPKGSATRPTSDRAREAIFNVLAHGLDSPNLKGAKVVDVFAGTGALGLEALSRGAAYATFIESSHSAVRILKDNIAQLGEDASTAVIARKVVAIGPAPKFGPDSGQGLAGSGGADFVFLDAPYDQGLSEPALAKLAENNWLKDGTVLVVEVALHEELTLPPGFSLLKEKAYGAARVLFLTYRP
jgi:16S rRNA (guanine966-N2)-methyltransferase